MKPELMTNEVIDHAIDTIYDNCQSLIVLGKADHEGPRKTFCFAKGGIDDLEELIDAFTKSIE